MDLKANLTKAQTTVKTSDMKLKHNAEALKKAKAEMKKVSFYKFHNIILVDLTQLIIPKTKKPECRYLGDLHFYILATSQIFFFPTRLDSFVLSTLLKFLEWFWNVMELNYIMKFWWNSKI